MNRWVMRLVLFPLFISCCTVAMEKETYYKSLKIIKGPGVYTTKLNENNNILTVINNNKLYPYIAVYDVAKKKKLHLFNAHEYTILTTGSLIVLSKKKSKFEHPFWCYNSQTNKVKKLDYTPKKGYRLFGAATNTKENSCKALLMGNEKNMHTLVLFDENDDKQGKINLGNIYPVDMDISPAGDRVIVDNLRHLQPEFIIIDTEDKNNPVIIKTVNESFCFFHQRLNSFCNEKMVYSKDGNIKKEFLKKDVADSFLIGYYKNQFVLYDWETQQVLVYKTKGSKTKCIKQLLLPYDCEAKNLTASFITYKKKNKIRKRIVIYDDIGEDQNIYFYKR